jgi:hypothetical protein
MVLANELLIHSGPGVTGYRIDVCYMAKRRFSEMKALGHDYIIFNVNGDAFPSVSV